MAVVWNNRSRGGGLGAAKPRLVVRRVRAALGGTPRWPACADSPAKSRLLRSRFLALRRLG
jgi:hypothetical protein